MDENTRLSDEQPEKPKKLKRHFIIWVLLLGFVMLLLGQILGEMICLPLIRLAGDRGDIQFALMYLSFIGIHIVVLLFCLLWEKPAFRSFWHVKQGGGKGNTFKMLGLGLLIGIVMNGACILIAWLHGDLDLSMGVFHPGYLLFALACVFVQSAAEELLTRGYMMKTLGERYGVWVAAIANALFFGALHLMNNGITVTSFLSIVAIGFALSLVMIYFDSLWLCAALHTGWNFTQRLLFGLPNSGIVSQSSWFHLEGAKGSLCYDPVFGVEGTIVAVVIICVFGLLVFLRGRKQKA